MRYEERYEPHVTARSLDVLRAVLMQALALIGAGTAAGLTRLPESFHKPIGRLLRPAEALARRLLIILALKMDLAPLRRGSGAGKNKSRSRQVRGFCLTEPWPSTTPYAHRQPVGRPGPALRVFTLDGDFVGGPPPISTRDIPPEGAGLISRLKVLEEILNDPSPRARRLARWFEKRKPGKRPTPLKIGYPPISRRHELAEAVETVHHFALSAMARLDSS